MSDALQSPPTVNHLHAMRDDILWLAEQHSATNLRMFGSVARGAARPDSDVDFLVDFPSGTSLWDVVGLWQD